MAEMGDGFGSECHLLRYLGRHRNYFDQLICEHIGVHSIKWLDFHFDVAVGKKSKNKWNDGERKGLDFLPSTHPVVAKWRSFWPTSGNPPNWDAVGVASIDGREEWLLVEAKAHLGELTSDCQAVGAQSLKMIRAALDETSRIVGGARGEYWMRRYYQLANRLAVLAFLTRNGIAARLLLLYFTGDKRPDRKVCPKNPGGWAKALELQDRWLGLPTTHALSSQVHKIFVPIAPSN